MKTLLSLLLVVGLSLQAHSYRNVFFERMKYMDCSERLDPKPSEVRNYLGNCTLQLEMQLPGAVQAVMISGGGGDSDDVSDDVSNDISDDMSYEDDEESALYRVVIDYLEGLYMEDEEAAGELVGCMLQNKAMDLMSHPDLSNVDLLQCTPNFVETPEQLRPIVNCLKDLCIAAV